MLTALCAIGTILAVAAVVTQWMYRSIEVGDSPHLPLKDLLTLSKIAPEKWGYSPTLHCMSYRSPSTSWTVYYVYPNTVFGYLLLPVIKPKEVSELQKAWLKDIEEYQQKKKEEGEAEIVNEQKKVDECLNSLRHSACSSVFRGIATGKIDPSTIYTSTINGRNIL